MGAPDYKDFDAELLEQIKSGRNVAGRLLDSAQLRDLAKPFVNAKSPVYRVIDRRLQALRKAGKISHDGKVWEIVPPRSSGSPQ